MQVHQRLTTILDHWATRSIYQPATVEFMKYTMTHGPENAVAAMKEAHANPPQVCLQFLAAGTPIQIQKTQ